MLLSLLSTCLKVLDLRIALVIKEIVGTLYFFYLFIPVVLFNKSDYSLKLLLFSFISRIVHVNMTDIKEEEINSNDILLQSILSLLVYIIQY